MINVLIFFGATCVSFLIFRLVYRLERQIAELKDANERLRRRLDGPTEEEWAGLVERMKRV